MKKPANQRVAIRVPVTLQTTIAGQKVTQQGVTISVNDQGAMVQCSRRLDTGTTLEMQNDRTGQKQICKVALTPTEGQQAYLIPVEFASPAPGFWRIVFPRADWKPLRD